MGVSALLFLCLSVPAQPENLRPVSVGDQTTSLSARPTLTLQRYSEEIRPFAPVLSRDILDPPPPQAENTLAGNPGREPFLQAVNSAAELNELISSRDSGLLTDWRIVGPFGANPHADFNRQWAPERDQIKKSRYGSRKVEFLQFANGQVKLPSSLAPNGVFYAASEVYIYSEGDWRLFLESSGMIEVFIDGQQVLNGRHTLQPQSLRSDLKLAEGNHRVLVKFTGSAAPFRLAIMAPTGGLRPHLNIPSVVRPANADDVSAALH